MIPGHSKDEWGRMVPTRRRFLAQQEADRVSAALAHARAEVDRLERAQREAYELVESLRPNDSLSGVAAAGEHDGK